MIIYCLMVLMPGMIEPEEIQNKVHTMIKEMKELYDKELYL